MNAPGWVRRQLERPIGEVERRAAFIATMLVLIAAALLLAITSTGVPAARRAPDARPAVSAARASVAAAPSADALRTARRFLDGYLAFAYGRGPASAVRETTSSFAAALVRRARPAPPALRSLHPRVLALRATYASGRAFVVTALVKDGEVLEYPIRVLLASRGGRYLVSGLGGP